MKVYTVVKETSNSNPIIKEFNAVVCTGTFASKGEHFADLYSCRNSADCLVASAVKTSPAL